MKNLYFYLIIIIVLIVLIVLGYKNQTINSSRVDKRNFAISDTSLITKITLENRNLEKIKLNKKKSEWILNDSLKTNKYFIKLLLKTIKEMQIKSPISRAALPNVVKSMAIQNTELNLFHNNRKIKTIYIGGETPDQLGTFMMIHGAKEPYIIHIPGFNGYLSSRFSCKEEVWRSKQVFSNIIDAKYQLENSKKNVQKSHFSNLKNIYCEAFLSDNKNFQIKDIVNRQPFFILETINDKGIKNILYCIRKKPVKKGKYKDHQYDRERFYGFMNNTLMLIQYKQLENFTKKESIEDDFMPWKNLTSF